MKDLPHTRTVQRHMDDELGCAPGSGRGGTGLAFVAVSVLFAVAVAWAFAAWRGWV